MKTVRGECALHGWQDLFTYSESDCLTCPACYPNLHAALLKREALANAALLLRDQLRPGDGVEVVVVVSSTDGEYVAVSANVPNERAVAIMQAACAPVDHMQHEDLVLSEDHETAEKRST